MQKGLLNTLLKLLALCLLTGVWLVLSPIPALFWSIFIIWWGFRFDFRIIVASFFGLGCYVIGMYVPIPAYNVHNALIYLFLLLVIVVELRLAGHVKNWRPFRTQKHRKKALIKQIRPNFIDLRK
jgi:hypothetical protein